MTLRAVTSTSSRRGLRLLLALGGLLFLPLGGGPFGQGPMMPPERIESQGDRVSVFGGDIHIPANARHDGSIVVIGADAIVEGEVSRDVVVILGSLELSGHVGQNVVGVLADQKLRGAEVSRDVVNVLGSIELENSVVARELINILGSVDVDSASTAARNLVDISFGSWFPSFWWFLFVGRLLGKLIVFVLILLLAALLPERIRLIGEEAPARYAVAFLVGLLGYVGFFVVVSILSLTVIGLPLAILGFWVLKWLGVAGLFYAVGRRIGRSFGREMSLLGAVLLVFAVYLVLMLAPSALGLAGLVVLIVLSLLFFLLVEVPAIGLVILTRAGGRTSRPGILAPIPAPGASVDPVP